MKYKNIMNLKIKPTSNHDSMILRLYIYDGRWQQYDYATSTTTKNLNKTKILTVRRVS